MMKTCSMCGAAIQDLAELEKLSPREREVLELMRDGLKNGEIASRLVVQYCTVKNHVHNIITKLGVHSRTDAVRKVYGDKFAYAR